ncbi:MAG: MFS transporter [Promethearchaeota archaeon]
MKSIPTSQKFTSDFQSMIKIVYWNSFGFMFYMFIIPYLTSQYFVISGTEIGLVIAAQPFARLITTPIVGYLTDRTSKKRLVLIGSLGRTISYTIMFLSVIFNSIWGFASGIFIQGLIVGFFWPPYNSLIAQKSSKYYRAEAYGKRSGMIGKGSFVGAIISYGIFNLGEIFFPNQIWISMSPFIIFALINAYAGIKFYLNVDESIHFQESENNNGPNSDPRTKISPNLMKKWFWIGIIFFVTASLISTMNTMIGMPFIQLYLFEITSQSTEIIMAVMYASQILSLLLSPLFGEYIDKIKPWVGITLFSLIGAIQTYIFLQLKSLWALTIILIIDYSIARASTLVIENFSSRVSSKHRGKIFGLNEWMKLVGWILGPIIGGVAWDSISHQAPFIISIGVELFLIPIYLIGIYFLGRVVSEKIQTAKNKS